MKVWASTSAGAGEQPPGLVAASPSDGGPPTGEDTASAAAAGDAKGEVSKEAFLQYTTGLLGCIAACALEIAWRNASSDIESDVGDAPEEGTSVLPEAVVVVEVERAVLVHVRARFGDEPTGDPQGEPRGEPAHGDAIRKNAKRKYKEKNTKDTSREIPRST